MPYVLLQFSVTVELRVEVGFDVGEAIHHPYDKSEETTARARLSSVACK